MRRLFFTIIASLLLTLPTIAQEARTGLVIKTGGNEQTVQFDELRRITFDGTTVQIQKHNGTTISEDMADIIYIQAITKSTDITAPQISENLVGYISNDAITVNCAADATVEIFNISGSHIATMKLDAENGTISIATLPKGIYILRADGRTAKFLKR